MAPGHGDPPLALEEWQPPQVLGLSGRKASVTLKVPERSGHGGGHQHSTDFITQLTATLSYTHREKEGEREVKHKRQR